MAWRFRWAPPGVAPSGAYEMNAVRYRSFIGGSGPPYNVVDEEQPFRAGSYLKTITVDEAEVQLTILLQADTPELLWQSMAPLPELFNPTRTDSSGNYGGRLLVATPAQSESRFLRCVCLSGFKIDEPSLLPNSVEATLSFYANYPYWQENILNTSQGTPFGKNPQWFPVFPLLLSEPDENYVEVTVINSGNVTAYPVITLTGPLQRPQITNKTLPVGEGFFPLTATGGLELINNTQSVTIDMLKQTVIRNDGTNEIGKLFYSGTFWGLAPGANTIRFTILGPRLPSSSTKISIQWRNTYSGIE